MPSQGTRLLYFDPTQTVDRQGHLIRAKCSMEVRPNKPCDIQVNNQTIITIHGRKDMVLSSFSNSMVTIIGPEEVAKERLHSVATVKFTPKWPINQESGQTTAGIGEMLSAHLQNTPSFVLEYLKCPNNFKKYGMFISDTSIQPPYSWPVLTKGHKDSFSNVPRRSEKDRG